MVDLELCDEFNARESTRSQIIINHFIAIASDIGAILREYQPLRQCLASFECCVEEAVNESQSSILCHLVKSVSIYILSSPCSRIHGLNLHSISLSLY